MTDGGVDDGGVNDGGADLPDAGSQVPDAGGGTPGQWVPPPPVTVPPLPPPPDYSDYPVDAQGRPILAAGGSIEVVVNTTPDAITALDRCSDLITNCFEPGVRSLDACMLSAPRCGTAQPWNETNACCAESCWSAYAGLRSAGVDPLTATLNVFYDSPSCMPGVDAMLHGGAP